MRAFIDLASAGAQDPKAAFSGSSPPLQATVGNNYGAGLWSRSNDSLKLALVLALSYSAIIEIGLWVFRDELGGLFGPTLRSGRRLAASCRSMSPSIAVSAP